MNTLYGQDTQSIPGTSSSFVCHIPPELITAEDKAVKWLKGQIVPTPTVPVPDPTRRRLLISYAVPENDPAYRYIYSRSFIYDDAVGAIALTMTGQYRETEHLLSAIGRLIRTDGSLWFTYNTANSWPNEGDHEGAIIRTGAIAWVGYAYTFYLTTRMSENPDFLAEDIIAQKYLKYAQKIADYVTRRQVRSESDMRYGLVTGGSGRYDIRIKHDTNSPGSKTPIEEFHETEIDWVSIEHNIDIYFFLRDLGRVTGNSAYSKTAELVKKGLMRLWDENNGQFVRGIKIDRIDTALPLDGASWGALFLFSTGEHQKAEKCLKTIEQKFFCETKNFRGYKPYYNGSIYENEEVNAFYYPENPETGWSDLEIVWGEGTLGVAAAYTRAGRLREALSIVESTLPMQQNGGFRYASHTIPYQFNDYPSVASTAWFVIAVEMLKHTPSAMFFWNEDASRKE